MKMEKAITSFRGEYAFLSNMYSVPVEWNGNTYQKSKKNNKSTKTLETKEEKAFCKLN